MHKSVVNGGTQCVWFGNNLKVNLLLSEVQILVIWGRLRAFFVIIATNSGLSVCRIFILDLEPRVVADYSKLESSTIECHGLIAES